MYNLSFHALLLNSIQSYLHPNLQPNTIYLDHVTKQCVAAGEMNVFEGTLRDNDRGECVAAKSYIGV